MTNTNTTTPTRVERNGHLRWVTVSDLVINPRAQRELRPGWAAQIAADFNPDRFTAPLVSLRHDKHYVIDGQHRIEALRLMGRSAEQVQCWVYENLSEAEEADLFLWHNNRKPVNAFEKFTIAVHADRDVETDINRIVLANGLKVAINTPGGISAVAALRKVYEHSPKTLGRTLRLVRDAYGDDALRGHIIEGFGLVCERYNGELDDAAAVAKLSSVRGGLGALNTKAATNRKQTGKPMPQCVAAAAVEIINSGKGRKLPNWWASA